MFVVFSHFLSKHPHPMTIEINGHPELKAVAHRIAPSLHLDGIAAMLEELAEGSTPTHKK